MIDDLHNPHKEVKQWQNKYRNGTYVANNQKSYKNSSYYDRSLLYLNFVFTQRISHHKMSGHTSYPHLQNPRYNQCLLILMQRSVIGVIGMPTYLYNRLV